MSMEVRREKMPRAKKNVILDEVKEEIPVVEEPKKEEPKEKEVKKEGIVSGTVLLNVRKEPNGQVLTTLKEGDKIVILEEEGDWYRFAGGYVMKKYIK